MPGQPGLRQLLGANASESFDNIFGAYLALLDDEARAKAQRGEGAVALADAPVQLAEASIVGNSTSDADTMVIAQATTNQQSGGAAVPPAGGAGATSGETAAAGLTGAQIGILAGVGVIALAAGGGGGGGDGGSPAVTAPATPSSAATAAAGSGKVLAGGQTSDSSPTFSGTGQAGDTVTLLVDGTARGTTTVASNGTFSLQPSSPIADGAHTVTYTFTNAAGTSSASPPLSITVDTAAPTQTLTLVATDDVGSSQGALASGATTDDTTPALSGTLSAALGAGERVVVYDGTTALGNATVSGTSWTFTPAAQSAGAHSYTAKVVDAVDNQGGASTALALTIDTTTTPPPATPSSAATAAAGSGKVLLVGGETSDASLTFSGTGGQAGDTVTLLVDGNPAGTTTVASNGTFSLQPSSPIADGAHQVTYTFQNSAGASSPSPALAINVDTIAPTTTVVINHAADNAGAFTTNLASGASTDDTTPTLNVTLGSALQAGESIALYVDGVKSTTAAATLVSGNTYNITDAVLTNGATPSYAVVVEDAVGNHAALPGTTFDLTIATTPPSAVTMTIASVTDNNANGFATGTLTTGASTSDTDPTLNLTASGALGSGEVIGVFRDGTYVGNATLVSGNTYSYTDATITTGAHSYTAAVLSATGVAGTASSAFALTLANDETRGGTGVDTLTAASGGNNLYGGAGNDVLTGSSSNDDVFYGDPGADTIDGAGSEFNYVRFDLSGGGPVTVNLMTGTGTGGDAQGDTYANILGIMGTSAGGDVLIGNNLANTIAGLSASGTGSTGPDILTGNGGNDNFAFRMLSADSEFTVTDFTAGDIITLHSVVDISTPGLTIADITDTAITTGYHVTLHRTDVGGAVNDVSGVNAELRIVANNGLSDDTVITFTGAGATLGTDLSALISTNVLQLSTGGL